MAFKATILSQVGKSYKIEVKKGAEVYVFYRSYQGQDKHLADMQNLEDELNDNNKKAERDQKKQDKKDENNVDNVKRAVNEIIKNLVIDIPKTANVTQNKLDNLATNLQNRIDNFIGTL